jgi:NADH-quinone oxidoreductase subunit F
VKRPGLWELPFGTTAREILEEYAGGMQPGYTLKAWQPGGAGTDFLTEQHLDLPMDFDSIGKAGTRLGTALAMAVDNSINMVSLTRNIEEFFARESCGWCTPCRDGLPWSVKILRALEQGRGAGWGYRDPGAAVSLPGPGQDLLCPCARCGGAAAECHQVFRSEFEAGIAASPQESRKPLAGIHPTCSGERW